MKKLLLLSILAASIVLPSCEKFLEERSLTDITPTKLEDYEDLLYTNGYRTGAVKSQPQLYYMADDVEYYLLPPPLESTPYHKNLATFSWQADFMEGVRLAGGMTDYYNSWRLYYKLLLNVNIVLQDIDKVKATDSDKDWVKGQCHVLRAYYYFMLVNLYALPYNAANGDPETNPGVPLKLDANVSETGNPRNSVAEVYAQIRKDLDAGIPLLERDKREPENVYINHIAAHFLASRVALYMEDWQAAITHADYVLKYRPDLADLNNPPSGSITAPGCVESIWAYGDGYEIENVDELNYTVGLSSKFIQKYEPGDLRASVYFAEVPEEWKPYLAIPNFNFKLPERGTRTCWRTSEAYLNRAEAYLQLYRKNGDAAAGQKGLADINSLRSKRFAPGDFIPWAMAPADQLLAKCLDERHRELFWEEGHRWFDLRRSGMPRIEHIFRVEPGVTHTYVLEKNDPQYTLHIPLEALEKNGKLIQNPQITFERKPQ
ncbi:RagB/SusD family nutrient uptake outer membrane protein [Chitinophaga lutea]